ncbi:TPA: hypothetical protein R1930_002529, partial [Staphylococcus delphini]|nr:hypothetical protein [Staphylococcus delphini]
SMLKSILLLMLIGFLILEAMSTCLLTPIGFSLLIVTSLRLPTSIDSSMTTLILLLTSIDFPILEVMSTYLLTPIGFLPTIAT